MQDGVSSGAWLQTALRGPSLRKGGCSSVPTASQSEPQAAPISGRGDGGALISQVRQLCSAKGATGEPSAANVKFHLNWASCF